MNITRAQFAAYESVRQRGDYHMYDPRARQMTCLRPDTYRAIMEQYADLREEYPEVIENPEEWI